MKQLEIVYSHISDTEILECITGIIQDNWKKFRVSPAACGNHHAYNGGLYDHSTSVAILTAQICEHFSTAIHKSYTLDKSIAVAGALLHDIGKIRSYQTTQSGNIKRTHESTMMHHIPMGYHMAASAFEKFGLNEYKSTQILHIILSHHGRLEYRSPVTPQTDEAMIVHKADTLDAYIDADIYSKKIYNK